MVVVQNVEVIVNLAKVSKGFSGSRFPQLVSSIAISFRVHSQYWPKNIDEVYTFDNVAVKLLSETQVSPSLYLRKISVEDTSQTSSSRSVTQLHYDGWPNYGVPQSPDGIINLIDVVNQMVSFFGLQSLKILYQYNQQFPLLVHCSGGVGRSGVFAVVHSTLWYYWSYCTNVEMSGIELEKKVNISNTITNLRQQRHPWMVEGFGQFKFCYEVITEQLRRWMKK